MAERTTSICRNGTVVDVDVDDDGDVDVHIIRVNRNNRVRVFGPDDDPDSAAHIDAANGKVLE